MSASATKNINPVSVLIKELWIWLPVAVFVFFLASILMSGWEAGIIPNIEYPYSFIEDSQGVINVVKRAIEEPWFFQNWRSGYPFGSNHLDFPSSDTGSIALLKLVGFIFDDSFVAAYNLYFLLSFSIIFTSTYVVIRVLGVDVLYACAAGITYAFASFHFQRLPHYFYISFFFVPIFFYWVFRIIGVETQSTEKDLTLKECVWGAIMLFISTFFGAYYACFELLCLAFALIFIYFKWGFGRRFLYCAGAMVFVISGLLVNLAPALEYRKEFGTNSAVAARLMGESEVYGLKISQMLMPRVDHRSESLSGIAKTYMASFPLVNENHTANLGVIGVTGFSLSVIFVVALLAGRKIDNRILLPSAFIIFLTAFATVGGGAAIFSLLVSSQIRGWNRISIFILFLAIFVFYFTLTRFVDKYFSDGKIKNLVAFCISISLCAIALYDQTVSPCVDCAKQDRLVFHKEQSFVKEMEKQLPPGAAVYQLPYLSFPESGGINRLDDYDLLVPFFLSRDLKFSFGGMKGRPGEEFFSQISVLPIEDQVAVVKKLGFSAIYIDRRGYVDGAEKLEARLRELPNIEFLLEDPGVRSVYRITDPSPLVEAGTNPEIILKMAGFSSTPNFSFLGEALGTLPRQIGVFDGKSIATDGRPGFALFGPYKKLKAGRYNLKVFGTVKHVGGAWVDIVGLSDETKVFESDFKVSALDEPHVLVDQNFSLKKDISKLEVRFFATESSDFKITGYEITEDRQR
ncbi:hypothetical protein [Ottowia thiooxydans]|uniref:hypothetical protein n=1 Tax=Ottowia thiooxydans TaxID=219182 RepID=UPI0004062396|nr:hypothetical protein [Ottowia thiooxydans]